MLEVQRYLQSHTLNDLKAELGIYHYLHPTEPLVGLKYNQIESPKRHPIVRECRGLVLERDTWRVVAKSFDRFLNFHEDPQQNGSFQWDQCCVTTKHDGSLIILYWYNGSWRVNTSGSFGLGRCGESDMSWEQLFWNTSKMGYSGLDKAFTYVFELCTVWNKVVQLHVDPKVYLLSIFDIHTCEELSTINCKVAADRLGVKSLDYQWMGSIEEVERHISDMSRCDKTYEGVVISSGTLRYKIKSPTYLALHRLSGNGNVALPQYLIPIVLAGETDEVVAYFPELSTRITETKDMLEREYQEMLGYWKQNWQIGDQKPFAKAVIPCRWSGLLFQLRKDHGSSQTESLLRKKWEESGDMIVKRLV